LILSDFLSTYLEASWASLISISATEWIFDSLILWSAEAKTSLLYGEEESVNISEFPSFKVNTAS